MRIGLHNKLVLSIFVTLISLGTFVRIYHFQDRFNFSAEQASFLSKSIDIIHDKKIILIGPPISFKIGGREIYQGSGTYYFQIPFILLANFDPALSSLLLTLFSVVMVTPLFFGIKRLSGQPMALLVSAIYLLFPPFIEHTRFFWNPNYQLMLSPILIYLLSYIDRRKNYPYFLVGFVSGILLLFHYQFLVVTGMVLLYFLLKRTSIPNLFLYLIGVVSGFFPIILFELKHDFYNLRTIFTLLANLGSSSNISIYQTHYFLSIILVFLSLASVSLRHISLRRVILAISVLVVYSLLYLNQYPNHAYGMSPDWSYTKENYVFSLTSPYLNKDTNVINQIYDTQANVQKYLARINHLTLSDNYIDNRFLIVITDRDPKNDQSYEITTFMPRTEIKKIVIDDLHTVYIYQRK